MTLAVVHRHSFSTFGSDRMRLGDVCAGSSRESSSVRCLLAADGLGSADASWEGISLIGVTARDEGVCDASELSP
jgi:hypothetical protein